MRRDLALRYFLLRTLEQRKASIAPEVFREVANSLGVRTKSDGFEVAWTLRWGPPGRQLFGKEEFSFYRRGDVLSAGRSVEEPPVDQNADVANHFLQPALPGIKRSPSRAGSTFAGAPLHRSERARGLPAHLGARRRPSPPSRASPARRSSGSICWGEERRGPWLALLLVAFSSLAAGVLGLALPYALLHFLDSDPRYRLTRALMCLGAWGVALRSRPATIELNGVFGVTLAWACVFAVYRSLHLVHHRLLPLVAPFFFSGLALDGRAQQAVWGCIVSAALFSLEFWRRSVSSPPREPAAPGRGDWERFWSSQYQKKGVRRVLSFLRERLIARSVRDAFERHFPAAGLFLEAGSGSSQTSCLIRKRSRRLFCLDIAHEPLLHARTVTTIDGGLQGDLFRLPLRDGTLDGIWNLGVMEHFSAQEIDSVLGEFRRVLKPGARAILFWPPLFGWYKLGAVVLETLLRIVRGRRVQLYPHEISLYRGRDQVAGFCRRQGFQLERAGMTVADAFAYVVVVIRKGDPVLDHATEI